ncbi:CDGSH iron-sulfur domain-containing protein [Morganella morganii]|uniref:CDGSH iron-sulfur domain-containing protein n=1 Tax=Morganella morganii TaxID=582 RepID=UPI0023678471|nr:CDGSH iron-sulfur domain-containing protein [Morganella morganii]
MFKIKIVPNGPYVVSNLKNLVRVENKRNHKNILDSAIVKKYPDANEFHLCRCGMSGNKPFCDGSHVKVGFNGYESASRDSYIERSKVYESSGMSLLDDERCAFARFCHRERAEVWTLTESSDNPENKREAIEGASACPSGRLTAYVSGDLIENHYDDTIEISEDIENGVSASLNIKGDFELESSDGVVYEKRNRLSLCRCGKSRNKPFCDATHVSINFKD